MRYSLSDLQQSVSPVLEAIKTSCVNNRETVAVAESVTSGCIQLLLSTAAGAQDFFQGGLTVYNCAQKAIHLGIDPVFADSCNAVDPQIALDMAKAVCTKFRSQIGLSITGYATRVPEQGVDELFAFVAIVRDGQVLYQGRLTATEEGINAQWSYAVEVLRILADKLEQG